MALEWIARIFQRRKVSRAFGAYVSPTVVRRLLEQPGTVGPQVRHFQFVVVLAEDTNPQDVPAILRTVVNTLIRHRTTVMSIESSLVVGLLGVPFLDGNRRETRTEVVEALVRETGEQIRIAHGECDGTVGLLGGDLRKSYTGVIPGYSGVLKKLLEAQPGTAVEIS